MVTPSLKSLLRDVSVIALAGEVEWLVSGLFMDSRRVIPNALFFAVKGRQTDGNLFIEEAIERGARGIVSEQPPSPSNNVAHVQVASVPIAFAEMAARFYQHPDKTVKVIGVTGTNGKTTVATLTQFLLNHSHSRSGLLSTIRYDTGKRTLPAPYTTPKAADLFALLHEMREAQCAYAVMEISSHGIEQKRVYDLRFEAVAFLNLSSEHMDYHGSMEAYFEAKRRIFIGEQGPLPRVAVVNSDSPYGRRLLKTIPDSVEVITFGEAADATIRARDSVLDAQGSTFTVQWPGGEGRVRSPLIGRYNVSNVLAALALCHACGREIEALLPLLCQFQGVSGRMERILTDQPFNGIVDYAHTDDALCQVLKALRGITVGRLLVVFGCGGNRDRSKRPLMTQVVFEQADRAWATADNPRREPLCQIFADMKQGLEPRRLGSKMCFVEDRHRAIYNALDTALPGDCVLIAGKGHETTQEWDRVVLHFDDRRVAREWRRERKAAVS